MEGRAFCFTGAIQREENGKRLVRNDMHKLVEEHGGEVAKNVTKADVLVVADPSSTSSKVKQARDKGVTLMSEADFFKVIEG